MKPSVWISMIYFFLSDTILSRCAKYGYDTLNWNHVWAFVWYEFLCNFTNAIKRNKKKMKIIQFRKWFQLPFSHNQHQSKNRKTKRWFILYNSMHKSSIKICQFSLSVANQHEIVIWDETLFSLLNSNETRCVHTFDSQLNYE